MGAGTETIEPSSAVAWASLGAALLLLFCALRAPAKNWLLDYYPNPRFEGEAAPRAWMQRVNFEVPGDLLLRRVPDRPDFSVRFQSCLPLSEPTELAVRLSADDHARLYIDGNLVIDSADPESGSGRANHKRRKKDKGKRQLDLQAGSHPIRIEYSNTGGAGALRLELSQPGVTDARFQTRLRRPSLDGQCGST